MAEAVSDSVMLYYISVHQLINISKGNKINRQ